MLKSWMRSWTCSTPNRRKVIRREWTVEVLERRQVLSATAGLEADLGGYEEEEGIDTAGNEYHASPKVRTEAAGTATGDSGTVAAALDVSQTFLLHSNPIANHVIYLDFDGAVTSGTSWNSSFTGGADIVTPAYDFDGNIGSFSTSELERIQYIWQRVTEDFSPFNVDVTTQEPNLEALRKSGTGDTQWGIRVVIGGDGSWYGSAGGVAYVGSFNWNSDTPCFVFEANLGNGHEKYTAEAISHEAGHTLGLSHDGTSSSGYYEGQGTGTTGWAPIMGVGYYKELVQWSKGEYSGANQKQDDLAIITTQNGFSYRTDLVGDSISTAAAATVSGASVSGSGIIERPSDLDLFGFTTGAGTVSFTLSPSTRSPNLDIEATLLDSTGAIVTTANPIGSLSANLNATVPAGQYFLKINGVGEGDPLVTGYSDYGSLGQYSFTGTIVDASGLPTISIQDASVTEGGSLSFRVILSSATTSDITVNFATANGTAVDGSDYSGASGTLTFAAGETEKFVTINTIDDSLVEATETLLVNLSGASSNSAIADGQAQGSITDNDVAPPPPPMSLSINDVSTVEGNVNRRGVAVQTKVTFQVTLSQTPTSQVKVNWATSNVTATTANSDYVGASGSITFKPGQTSKTLTVVVLGDVSVEPDETFNVVLSGATGATIGDGTGICTIINDDGVSGAQIADAATESRQVLNAIPNQNNVVSVGRQQAATSGPANGDDQAARQSALATASAVVQEATPSNRAESPSTAEESSESINDSEADDLFEAIDSVMSELE